MWTCLSCTLLNSSESLKCLACGQKKKPNSSEQISKRLKMGSVHSSHSDASAGPSAAVWTCYRCSYENPGLSRNCEICETPRLSPSAADAGKHRKDVWSCENCTLSNPEGQAECEACGIPSTSSYNNFETKFGFSGTPTLPKPFQNLDNRVFSPKALQRQHSAHTDAVRLKQEREAKATWDRIVAFCEQTKEKFTDDSFPPTLKSLGTIPEDIRSKLELLVWRRPTKPVPLMRNPGPGDIEQGILGNCWFLSALAVVAEIPQYLQNIFVTPNYTPHGVYQIRLCIDGMWKIIIVDDYFPCRPESGTLVYSRCKRGQLWVPLVEKALAKEFGGYSALIAGKTLEGLSILTGAACESLKLREKRDGAINLEEHQDIVWARILSAKEAGYCMGCSCWGNDSLTEAAYESVGLQSSHAYSVLDVKEIGNGQRLIKLRNPWGRFAWTGPWSENSPNWTPGLKSLLMPKGSESGVFWMPYEEFCVYFCDVEIAKTRRDWNELRLSCFLNPHARRGYVQAFRIIVTEPQEIDLTLYQEGFRHEDQAKAGILDLGFVILKEGDHSEGESTFETWSRRKIYSFIGKDHVFTPGCYLVVLTTFSHWGLGLSDTDIPKAILALHSPAKVFVERFQASEFLLADAMAKTIRAVGKRHASDLEKLQTWYLQDGFRGQAVLVENHYHDKFVVVDTNCSESANVISTRGTLQLTDSVPPRHRQIIVILSQLESTSSYYVTHRLHFRTANNGLGHVPELTPYVYGLHAPRPL